MIISEYILPASIFLGFMLSAIWLVFFLLEDKKKPEPATMITKTFAIGIVSALAAIGIGKFFAYFAPTLGIIEFSVASISAYAFIEELVKFLAVFIFISHTKHFDEPIDRMIYMIVAALGFAVAENFLFLINTVTALEMVGLATLRFIGATLMHALSSGILGYMWARQKIYYGLIIATFIHIIFNLLILEFGPQFYPTIFLVFVAFILFYQFDRIKTYHYEKQKYRKQSK